MPLQTTPSHMVIVPRDRVAMTVTPTRSPRGTVKILQTTDLTVALALSDLGTA